jgi:hypothetical protein
MTDSGEWLADGNDLTELAEHSDVKDSLKDYGTRVLVYEVVGEFKFGGVCYEKKEGR